MIIIARNSQRRSQNLDPRCRAFVMIIFVTASNYLVHEQGIAAYITWAQTEKHEKPDIQGVLCLQKSQGRFNLQGGLCEASVSNASGPSDVSSPRFFSQLLSGGPGLVFFSFFSDLIVGAVR